MAKKQLSPYAALVEKSTAIHHFNSILSLLHWDQETYMPPGAIGARSEQIAQLSHLIHEEKLSPSYKAALAKLVHLKSGQIKAKHLSQEQRAALREWHKDYSKAKLLPSSFVKTFSQVTSESAQVWSIAKKSNNFALFAPFLEKIIRLNREKAEILGFEDHPYDALLEAYEPCMSSKRVSQIFGKLQQELVQLIRKIGNAKQPDVRFLTRAITDAKQHEIGQWIASQMPVDKAYTRLDVSSHPFSIALHPRDSRITTRYLPHSFMSNIFSILHEAGHSMYEMGLPIKHWGTPLAEATSLSVHESQSRWWETLLGRSMPFWKRFYPTLQEKLPAVLGKISLEKFYRAIHQVTPSFTRVEADEVTYGLHVILRFELEKQLISGTLSVGDLPDAWNAKFKELFGIVPPTPAQGCLQDIHWSLGDFGYFPTYALGNLLAAQFFGAFAKEHPDWGTRVERGDLAFVREWLKKNIHAHGKRYNLDELAKRVSGEPLSEAAYCKYLKKKYAELYQL